MHGYDKFAEYTALLSGWFNFRQHITVMLYRGSCQAELLAQVDISTMRTLFSREFAHKYPRGVHGIPTFAIRNNKADMQNIFKTNKMNLTKH